MPSWGIIPAYSMKKAFKHFFTKQFRQKIVDKDFYNNLNIPDWITYFCVLIGFITLGIGIYFSLRDIYAR